MNFKLLAIGFSLACLMCNATRVVAAPGTLKDKLRLGETLTQDFSTSGADIALQIGNRSNDQYLGACCSYVNLNAHCSNFPGVVCSSPADCFSADCLPGCTWSAFRIAIPPKSLKQDLVWFPATGDLANGIPPVPELPFSGDLVCSGVLLTPIATTDFECPIVNPCP